MQTVAFNDKLLLELNTDVREFENDVRLGTAIWYFIKHRLTLGQAAELAVKSQYEFMQCLNENGVASIDYPAEDLKKELSY